VCEGRQSLKITSNMMTGMEASGDRLIRRVLCLVAGSRSNRPNRRLTSGRRIVAMRVVVGGLYVQRWRSARSNTGRQRGQRADVGAP